MLIPVRSLISTVFSKIFSKKSLAQSNSFSSAAGIGWPKLLLILDGWGHNKNKKHNAIAQAYKPTWDHIWQNYPRTLLKASGSAVGLPDDQVGNSEAGHGNIGAGRVLFQDLTLIDNMIQQGQFEKKPVFLDAIHTLKKNGHALHIPNANEFSVFP